jgi:lycopene cyclase domain-containing protein
MTYLQFLLLFLGIPLCIVFSLYKKSELPHKKEYRFAIMLLIFLAVSYTTPWDNYLVRTGVWMYGEGRILGTIGYVPIEEYCFFILQTILSGLICFLLQRTLPLTKKAPSSGAKKTVAVGYALCFLLGVVCLNFDKSRYLGLILAWAMPVILLQWFFGGNHLLTNLKIFLLSIFIPTIYLWIADGLAIHWGIWDISQAYTMGFKIGSLPFEEAIFFLVTNVMVSQGVILFVVMDEEIAKVTVSFRRILKWVG